MIFEKVRKNILENKKIKKAGGHIGIPYPFAKLREYVPVIDKGMSIGVLGPTGSGKSRFVRYVYLYNVYDFYKKTGYPVRIVLLALEDNKEKIMRNIICHYLKEVHDIYITLQELDSKGDRHLPDFVEEKLLEADEYFQEFEKVVFLVDTEHEPTEIHKNCETIAHQLGTVEEYEMETDGGLIKQKRYNSDIHVVCIVDNMSNVDEEEGYSEHSSINMFAKEYIRGSLCNFYGWTVVQVLQQDFESERPSVLKDGSFMINKLKPALSNIGDSKRVARSMHLVFGLFSPAKFEILRYPHPPKSNPEAFYDIEILGNRFRGLEVIKSNDTDTGIKMGLLFDGIGETFKELPIPGSDEMKEIYGKISNKPKYVKVTNQLHFQEEDEASPF